MAIQIQQLGGTTEQLAEFTGKDRVLVVNSDTRRVHVMDGKTKGGIPLAKLADIKDPVATEVAYTNYGKKNVAEALDELLYKAPQISNFKTNVATQEMGATVTAVSLSWSVNKTPTALTLDDEALDAAATKKDLADQTITADKTFTLVMTDEKKATATAKTSILFRNGAYYGVSNKAADADITKEFVAGLTKTLTDSYKRDITVTAGEGEYIYYAFPTRFGASPRFFVGGFEGGFSKVKTFDYENPSGYTESYDVYRSTNANLGATVVNVQ